MMMRSIRSPLLHPLRGEGVEVQQNLLKYFLNQLSIIKEIIYILMNLVDLRANCKAIR